MPWAERNLVSLREEFVRVAETAGLTMSELCRRFGISRKTGYKWVGRGLGGFSSCRGGPEGHDELLWYGEKT